MTQSATEFFADISALRAELVDLAFVLDRRGRVDAADVALGLSHRLTELCDRFSGSVSTGAGGPEDADLTPACMEIAG